MDFFKLFLDPYDRPARLVPGLLVIAPLPVLVVCLVGDGKALIASIVSVLASCGVGYVIARIARNAGKRLQKELFERWGGAPTTQLLRHRDNHFDQHSKQRFHELLSAGVGKAMPSKRSESANPTAADELYRAGTEWLIGQTFDAKQFARVFKENVAFGFHRNALGMRPYGILLAAGCIFYVLFAGRVLTIAPPYLSLAQLLQLPAAMFVSLGISTLMLIAWVLWLTEEGAKQAGFAYAERLIQSCHHIRAPAGS